MEIRNSKSVTLDLYYDELGLIIRSLESYVAGDLNDRAEFAHATSMLLSLQCFIHR